MTLSEILLSLSGLLLLLIPSVLFFLFCRPLFSRLCMSVGRMLLQMGFLGLCTWVLYHVDSLWLCLLWLLLMSVVSAWVVVGRTHLVWGRMFLPVVVGTFLAVLLIGGWGVLFASRLLPIPSSLLFVPVTGVLLAHVLVTNTRSLSAFYEQLKADVLTYETSLANGNSHIKSLLPFVGYGLQAIVRPATTALKVMGLFALPMLFAGMLVGGLSPVKATVLTIVFTLACMTASVLSYLLILLAADRRTFDRRGNLLLALLLLLTLSSCKNSPAPDTFVSTTTASLNASAEKGEKRQDVPSYEIPAPLKDRPEQILRRTGYTVSYNRETRCANWVAWHLTKSHTYGKNQRAQEKFTEDADVPSPRAVDADYYNSRYDRGHLCPAGDNKWDAQVMRESFLFTNVCPQNHGLNKYEWNDLEILCRDWARQYGAIDIVAGPIYDQPRDKQKTIGRNKVWVPDRLFKVILCRKGMGQPRAIGFIYRNEGVKQPMQQAVCTVDEVERVTGIDFFPALDDGTERRIEAEADLADW